MSIELASTISGAPVSRWKRYAAYRDSGVEWRGEGPDEWASTAVKHHFGIQLGKMLQNKPDSDELLVPYAKALHVLWGKVETNDLPEMWANTFEIQQYGIKEEDLLVCEGGEVGRAGIVKSPPKQCIIQNALHRVRAKNTSDLRYLLYVLYAVNSSTWFDVLCNKATIAHFTREKFSDLNIPVPSLPEQRAIAAFLDRETGRIDTLIEKKERQVELLQEKRAALISHVVTKGLDPDVKMKDSGVEWLGEFPEHWEMLALKRLASLKSGESITVESIDKDGDYPVFGGNGLRGYTTTFTHDGNYVLIGRQGALCGNINYAQGQFWASEHAVVVSPIGPVETKWLGELLRAMNLNQYSVSAAQPGLSVEMVSNLSIPQPPLQEQSTIAAFLGRETGRIDTLSTKISESISKLREYRTALISAAVTGKIDVRNKET